MAAKKGMFKGFKPQNLNKEQVPTPKESDGKLQAYLFLALGENQEITPDTVKFAPIIVKNLEEGIKEFETIYPKYNIIGITPLATLIKQMTLLEVFATKNDYDFNELIQNAMLLIKEEN